MKKPPDTFAARLRSLRAEAGLSVAALAEKAGIARTSLHNIEAGRREPTFSTLQRLALALGVSLAAFDNVTS